MANVNDLLRETRAVLGARYGWQFGLPLANSSPMYMGGAHSAQYVLNNGVNCSGLFNQAYGRLGLGFRGGTLHWFRHLTNMRVVTEAEISRGLPVGTIIMNDFVDDEEQGHIVMVTDKKTASGEQLTIGSDAFDNANTLQPGVTERRTVRSIISLMQYWTGGTVYFGVAPEIGVGLNTATTFKVPWFEEEDLQILTPNAPRPRIKMMFPYLWMAMLEANITTYRRAIHFLAQLLHESGELIYMEEIADGSAYEGRSDLGNVYRGDGRRYKGRGPIQLTGRANYRAAGKALGLDLEGRPAIAADPSVGFRIAAWYWTSRNLNYYADMGDSGFDAITYRINGGYNGLYQRAAFYNHAAKVLPSPFDIGGGLVLQKVVLAATGDPDLVEAFKVAALLRKYNIFATVADAMNIQPADGVCWSTPIGTFDFFVIGKPAYNLMHTGHTPLIGKSADKTDYRDAVGAGFDDTKRKLALRLTELGKKRKLTIDLGEEYKKGV